MQPVLEIRKIRDHSYVYSVRGPRSSGKLPAACYVDGDQTSFAACLSDAAQALTAYFPRIYIRYQGMCVGEQQLQRLNLQPVEVARELLDRYLDSVGVTAPPMPVPV